MEQKSEILAKDIFNIHDKINVEKLEEVYLNYKKGIFYVSDRYEPVKITEGNIWDTEYHDRTWLFWHHCLICVEYLIDSFYIDRNVKKIQLAFELVEDWYNVNYPKSPVVMGWHDHSTALRLINILKLYTIFKEYEEVEKCTLLAQIAEKHIIKLKDTDFYMPKHNHGLDQDIAILYSAQVMSELENRESLVKLALERLFEQISRTFSSIYLFNIDKIIKCV